jgi:hypothetical protein
MSIECDSQTGSFATLSSRRHEGVCFNSWTHDLRILPFTQSEKFLKTVMLFIGHLEGMKFWLFSKVVLINIDIIESA